MNTPMPDKPIKPLTGIASRPAPQPARLLGEEEVEEMAAERKARAKRRALAKRAKEKKS